MLSPKTALSLGLIFHELTTNAAKYGALTRPDGGIVVTCEALAEPSDLTRLVWREIGVGDCERPARTGFGTQLIETSVRHDLRGSVEIAYPPEGIVYELVFPATA